MRRVRVSDFIFFHKNASKDSYPVLEKSTNTPPFFTMTSFSQFIHFTWWNTAQGIDHSTRKNLILFGRLVSISEDLDFLSWERLESPKWLQQQVANSPSYWSPSKTCEVKASTLLLGLEAEKSGKTRDRDGFLCTQSSLSYFFHYPSSKVLNKEEICFKFQQFC